MRVTKLASVALLIACLAVGSGRRAFAQTCAPSFPSNVNTSLQWAGASSGCSNPYTSCIPGETITFRALPYPYRDLSCEKFTWDFGDGGTSTLTSPTHTYSGNSTYTLKLHLVGSGSTADLLETVLVGAACGTLSTSSAYIGYNGPVSGCTTSAGNCNPGEQLAFHAYSQNGYAFGCADHTFTWNFGDNANATGQIPPPHAYAAAGNYSASVTIFNGYQQATIVQPVKVGNVTTPPPTACPALNLTNVSLQYSGQLAACRPGGTCVSGEAVTFSVESAGYPLPCGTHTYQWQTDDGFTSSSPSPQHSFPAQHDYTVRVIIMNPIGSSVSLSQTVHVVNPPPPVVAEFTWSPPAPTTGQRVTFTDRSANSPTQWEWNFGTSGLGASRDQSPQVTFPKAGTFSITLVVSNLISSSAITKSLAVVDLADRTCSVSPLASSSLPEWEPILGNDGKWTTNVPTDSLYPPRVDARLNSAAISLLESLRRLDGVSITLLSGYRPFAHQLHLRELSLQFARLLAAKKLNSEMSTLCAAEIAALNGEIARHGLPRVVSSDCFGGNTKEFCGSPVVPLPQTSDHTALPATALDLSVKTLPAGPMQIVLRRMSEVGLDRPCKKNGTVWDPVHFQLAGTPCGQKLTVKGTAHSPVAILLTAPDGRKIGFDPSFGRPVNDFGDLGRYTGAEADPQEVEISGVGEGPFTLTAIGTAAGRYELDLDAYTGEADGSDPSDIIAHAASSGVAIAGVRVTPVVIVAPGSDPPTPAGSKRRRPAKP